MEKKPCEVECEDVEEMEEDKYSQLGDQNDVIVSSDESNFGGEDFSNANESDEQDLPFDEDNYEYDEDFMPEEVRYCRSNHIHSFNSTHNHYNEVRNSRELYHRSLQQPHEQETRPKSYLNFSYGKVIFVSLALILVQHLGKVIYFCGFHRTVFDHSPGPCTEIKGIASGSANIATLKNGMAFIASAYAPHLSDRGRIYSFDQFGKSLTELSFSEDFNKSQFWPQGLSAWQNPADGYTVLFVINHHPIGDRIEKFEYIRNSSRLEHIDTILDVNLHMGNNIVALDAKRFYFTNIGYNTDKNLLFLEVFLMLSWGNVVFYDGEKSHVVTRGFVPNGLALSPNNEYLYLANAGTEDIRVFRLNQHDGSLQFIMFFSIEAGIANINVDRETGDLWVGAFNSFAEFIPHEKNPVMPCGSRVFRLKTSAEGAKLVSLTEVYASRGEDGQSCSTVASFVNGSLLIGAVRRPPLLCQVLHV